ncbi:hypothetical protein DPEC_G00100260 [Dallia pectoralis]|uniref:Uncharacterized protein n=1 Tax=Dallia pectoralis TaxID=75939 RepID=A0ACC2GWW8_DALPE|nr:hypothetical protein DPEC_G00100260 [Dallia pectoralis]
METLNEMRSLRSSGFGKPRPRHGLHLLYWFADEYVKIDDDGDLRIERNLRKKAFGFKPFHDQGELLPDQGLPFFEVGNLDAPKADELPDYVRNNYTGQNDKSNIDRIIISPDEDKVLDRIYVTQHDHHRNAFDPQRTFRISKGLIKLICKLELAEFLEEAGYRLPCGSARVTLNEMDHLRSSGFGKPRPCHGLHLLHWFANEYVKIDDDGDMMIVRNLSKKAFGFKPFNDQSELLPDQGLPFFEVGNLGAPKAEELPYYVRNNYTGQNDDSNIDRIIISPDEDKVLDRIYVTQHDHHSNTFDPQHTFRISKGLIKLIRTLDLDEFLEEAEYS